MSDPPQPPPAGLAAGGAGSTSEPPEWARGGRPLTQRPGARPPVHPILGREDEVITTAEWQKRLKTKHLSDAYPQQFHAQNPQMFQQQELGTKSFLGLFESTGPLLGDDPKRLGKFRVITLTVTAFMCGCIFMNMPANDHKGRPTIFASVQQRIGGSIDRVLGLQNKTGK